MESNPLQITIPLPSPSKSEIQNTSFSSEIDSLITCPLCSKLICSPVQCSQCQSCFCSTCLKSFQKETKNSCPNCQKDQIQIDKNDLDSQFFNSKIISTLLSKLKFTCKNCNETINYNDYENHYDLLCKKINFENRYQELKSIYCNLKNELQKDKILKHEMLKKSDELDRIIQKQILCENKQKEKKGNFIEDGFRYKTEYHEHYLVFCKIKRIGWKCDICGSPKTGLVGSYYCTACDYDICNACMDKINFENV